MTRLNLEITKLRSSLSEWESVLSEVLPGVGSSSSSSYRGRGDSGKKSLTTDSLRQYLAKSQHDLLFASEQRQKTELELGKLTTLVDEDVSRPTGRHSFIHLVSVAHSSSFLQSFSSTSLATFLHLLLLSTSLLAHFSLPVSLHLPSPPPLLSPHLPSLHLLPSSSPPPHLLSFLLLASSSLSPPPYLLRLHLLLFDYFFFASPLPLLPDLHFTQRCRPRFRI